MNNYACIRANGERILDFFSLKPMPVETKAMFYLCIVICIEYIFYYLNFFSLLKYLVTRFQLYFEL